MRFMWLMGAVGCTAAAFVQAPEEYGPLAFAFLAGLQVMAWFVDLGGDDGDGGTPVVAETCRGE